MELFLFLSCLLQRFTLSPVPGELPSLEGVLGFTHSPQDFRMVAVPHWFSPPFIIQTKRETSASSCTPEMFYVICICWTFLQTVQLIFLVSFVASHEETCLHILFMMVNIWSFVKKTEVKIPVWEDQVTNNRLLRILWLFTLDTHDCGSITVSFIEWCLNTLN